MTTTTFGQWLRQRRKALGMTQKVLAQGAGCAEVTLRKIEAGDLQPSAPLVASLAQVLGVDDADLPGLVALARGLEDDFSTRARLLRPQRPNNLPVQLTPLIGRGHDITAVRRRLIGDGARLITLVGPPGVGKTRLALAVTEDVLEQFADGAFFVRLAPISDPTHVASAIAQALGMQMSGPNPPELQLRAYLEEKHLLLVLDNFEQILAAAPLVDDLLRRCPWLHVLVTSRQPLRVRGERQITVRPLPLPTAAPREIPVTAQDMLRYPAVALFADRAEAVMPDFAVDDDNAAAVAELCRRLDGLPLAIELVAARVKLLPPADLLTRLHGLWLLSTDGLRDVSARQKTLRGAIGWSYDLLTPVEQTLFTRLAVFVGGCTLEAAEMMCEDVLSPGQVLDGISSLLDKSLLHRETGMYGGTRYSMLETVREYGLERVIVRGEEAALRERHAHCILRLVEEAENVALLPAKHQLCKLIDDDLHNVRTALNWAMQHNAQDALLLTTALVRWLFGRGPYAEGRLLVTRLLAMPDAAAHTIRRATLLFEAGLLLLATREIDQARAYEEESLMLSQELGYERGMADALLGLGRVAGSGWNDWSAAQRYFERSLVIYRELHDPGGIAYASAQLGYSALLRQDYLQARAMAEEGIVIARQAGVLNPWAELVFGNIAYALGDLREARSLWEQALANMDYSKGMKADTLEWIGLVAVLQGDFAAAHAFLDKSLMLWKELHNERLAHIIIAPFMATLFQTHGDHYVAVRWYRIGLPGVPHSRDHWGFLGLGLASLAVTLSQYELAAKLLGATHAADEGDSCLLPVERDNYNRITEMVRVHLDAARFDAVWTQGHVPTFEMAVTEAVSILETVLAAHTRVATA